MAPTCCLGRGPSWTGAWTSTPSSVLSFPIHAVRKPCPAPSPHTPQHPLTVHAASICLRQGQNASPAPASLIMPPASAARDSPPREALLSCEVSQQDCCRMWGSWWLSNDTFPPPALPGPPFLGPAGSEQPVDSRSPGEGTLDMEPEWEPKTVLAVCPTAGMPVASEAWRSSTGPGPAGVLQSPHKAPGPS